MFIQITKQIFLIAARKNAPHRNIKMLSRLSSSTYKLQNLPVHSNDSNVYLIGFSHSKASPFIEFFLGNKFTNAIAFNLKAPFWFCVIGSFFKGRGHKTFYVWSNIHSIGRLNKVAKKICDLLSFEVYCIEDGLFKGNIIRATTSFSYAITQNQCYFTDKYWQGRCKIEQSIFEDLDFQSFKQFYKIPEFSGTKYAEPLAIEKKATSNVEKTIVIIGQVDNDRALRQPAYKNVANNIDFIKWALANPNHKSAKIVFRPHPYDFEQETIDFCKRHDIGICKKNLEQYTDEVFVVRTSMLSLDLTAKGHEVIFYSENAWANELMKTCDAGNDSVELQALKAKYYLLRKHHLFSSITNDIYFESAELQHYVFIFCLNKLIDQLGSVPETVIEKLSLSSQVDDNFNISLYYFGHKVEVTFGTWDYFLITHSLARLGKREYAKHCVSAATHLLESASTANTLELAFQLKTISHLCSDVSSAHVFTKSLWKKLQNTSDDQLLMLDFTDAIDLIFRFGAYICLQDVLSLIRRWKVLATNASFLQYDTRLNSSFIKFYGRIDNYIYTKSFFIDLPGARVKLNQYIDEIKSVFANLVPDNSYKNSVRQGIVNYLYTGETKIKKRRLPILASSFDFLILKELILHVTRNPQDKNIEFIKLVICSYFGGQLLNWEKVEQFLWSKRKPALEDFSSEMFRIKFFVKLLNPKKLNIIRNPSSALTFKKNYEVQISKLPKINGEPKEVIVLFFGGCLNSHSMFFELLALFTKRGVAVIDPFETSGQFCLNFEPSQLPDVEKIPTYRALQDSLTHSWDIRWDEKLVLNDDINYYQGLYERISTYYRRYDIGLEEPEELALFKYELLRSDKILTILNSMLKMQESSGLKVTCFLSNSHVSPYFMVKQKMSKLNVPFYLIGPTYSRFLEPNFKNSTASFKIAKYQNRFSKRAPFLISNNDLDAWKIRNFDKLDFYRKQTQLILQERILTSKIYDRHALKKYDIWRKNNPTGKALLCLGKVSVDLGHQYDGGHIFSGYKEYILGLYDFASRNPNIFVFFRPHPHEVNSEVALALVDKMSNWVVDDGQNNISLITPEQVSVGKMVNIVDITTVYNGSPILEFNALGLPIVPFSHQAEIDYPVGQTQLKDLDAILDRDFTVAVEAKQKALDLISCSFFDDTAFYSKYTRFASHNLSVNVPAFVINDDTNQASAAILPNEL